MTSEQIIALQNSRRFPDGAGDLELIETHISWVFLGDAFVWKIMKPVQFSFLDFSNLEKRKIDCENEVRLNSRLTDMCFGWTYASGLMLASHRRQSMYVPPSITTKAKDRTGNAQL